MSQRNRNSFDRYNRYDKSHAVRPARNGIERALALHRAVIAVGHEMAWRSATAETVIGALAGQNPTNWCANPYYLCNKLS